MRGLDRSVRGPSVIARRVKGARLTLPRDRDIAYVVGRLGVTTIADCFRLFFTNPKIARRAFRRLVRLGVLRSFEREAPSLPRWFAISPAGREWVMESLDIDDEQELRPVTGIRRLNLAARSMRNTFWISAILSTRLHPGVVLERVSPEHELRIAASMAKLPIVPDVLLLLALGEQRVGWLVELDGGSERTTVIKKKACEYAARRGGHLFGLTRWHLLFVVPTLRRGRTVARAVADGGAGAFTYLGIEADLALGHVLDPLLLLASDLAASAMPAKRWSLLTPLTNPAHQPGVSVAPVSVIKNRGAV